MFNSFFSVSTILLFSLVMLSNITLWSQAGNIDDTFNKVDSAGIHYGLWNTGGFGQAKAMVRQPDGKIIVGGDALTYNGQSINMLCRLTADGDLDTTFKISSPLMTEALALQADGKILVAGYFTEYEGLSRSGILRLNEDGKLDESFNPGTGVIADFENHIHSMLVTNTNQIYIVGNFKKYNQIDRPGVARLNSNGTIDGDFNPPASISTFRPFETPVSIGIAVQGSQLLVGLSTRIDGTLISAGISRFNANGTLDTDFASAQGANADVTQIRVLSNNQIIIAGGFTTYRGIPRNRIARINQNGTNDATFNPGTGANQFINTIEILENGSIMIGGGFTTYNNVSRIKVARISANGALETYIGNIDALNSSVYSIISRPNNQLVIGGFFRNYNGRRVNNIVGAVNTNGTIDEFFNPPYGTNGDARTLLRLQNGKILVTGLFFTHYNKKSRSRIAIINEDGTIDEAFLPGTGANNWVTNAVQQPDGKIIIAGFFTEYSGVSRNRIARINLNGTLDETFNPGTGANSIIYDLALLDGNKILIGGGFTSFNDITVNRIAILDNNGNIDPAFPSGSGVNNGNVYKILVNAEGKIILGGTFTQYNGNNAGRIVMINQTGMADPAFNAGTGFTTTNASVWWLEAAGNYFYAGGSFLNYNGTATARIVRLAYDGTLDQSFNLEGPGPNADVRNIKVQPDGRIIIGGTFTLVNESNSGRIARLQPNGLPDAQFDAGTGFNGSVFGLLPSLDNRRMLIAGGFTTFNNEQKHRIAQLKTPYTLTTTGGGLWSNPANWPNGEVPTLIDDGMEVLVNPGGDGVLTMDIEVTVNNGGRLTVAPGKQLIVNNNLIIK